MKAGNETEIYKQGYKDGYNDGENARIDPDYWTRLEHQASIAAMGGMCSNTSYDKATLEGMAKDAIRAAHALVQKMKEE